ncbi:acyl-CoA carboxylase subunit epsilon [Amycolatopsis sp. H20-H5]|uniref:acyl-CoA carboxylase subunit epsilon n=1 Tax=Amycolatopsis sp. H20-H5 TaxID=3046309 RepID=UPI002DBE0E9D|nr:acyl-CoA carboxylase subunit epsilon [Amycolatopsis sp. H20-H5]MEC3978114.1 acyl-CoA carboxylase subunit epsilon [Amycolatopsis sp. H20-H5]
MTDSPRPLLRVVRGNPSDAELAALTAVVAVASRSRGTEAPAPRHSWWADKASAVREPLRPGEGAWRASALPR